MASQGSEPAPFPAVEGVERNTDVAEKKHMEAIDLYSYSYIIKEAKNLATTIQ
jgi:hypothetical protein